MARMPNEIEVLRFFEEGPIERVDAVFHIVSEKMRDRLKKRDGGPPAKEEGPARKRRAASNAATPMPDAAEQDEPAA